MKFASYIRVSSKRQVEEGDSLEGQRRQIELWAKREGHEIVVEYCDKGQSAFYSSRDGFDRLMRDATSPNRIFDGIITYNFSRLSRTNLQFLTALKELDEAKIEVQSVNDHLPKEKKAARLMAAITGAINENQSEQNSETVKDRLTETAEQGFFTGGVPSYGYQSVNAPVAITGDRKRRKMLAINQEEAGNVKLVFKLADQGLNGVQLGLKKIATHLNQQGLTYRGKKWTTNTVDRLLNNSIYYGYRVFGKNRNGADPKCQPIVMKVPPIIEKEQFDRVTSLLKSRRPGKNPKRNVQSYHILTGLLKCGECNSDYRITTGKSGAYKYYKCGQKVNVDVNCCSGRNIPKDAIEREVIEGLKQYLLVPERLLSITQEFKSTAKERNAGARQRILNHQHELARIKAEISNLYNHIARETLTLDSTLTKHLRTLKLQKSSTESEINSLKSSISLPYLNFGYDQVKSFVQGSLELLAKDNKDLIRSYLTSVVQKITVKKKSLTVQGANFQAVRAIAPKKMGTAYTVPTSFTIWRRERDSNPRYAINVYTLSRRAPSATQPSLQIVLFCIEQNI